MNSDNRDLLLDCIKNGGRVPDISVDVKKLLESAKMELYTAICCNRIRESGIVDGLHVLQDRKSSGNLIVDFIGLEKCKPIIEGYIGEEEYERELTTLQNLQDITTYLNNVLYTIRKNSNKELRELYREVRALKETELNDFDITPELFMEELKYRKRFWKERILKRMSFTWALVSRFSVKLKAAWRLSGMDGSQYDGGTYYNALVRFKVKHSKHKKPKRLKRDDLKKFVFLGVKAFGREYLNNRRSSRFKSCEEIEWIYENTNVVMKALGLLTPVELMQLFPITKDFDSGKYGCKDYFWTVDKINALPQDEPIGTEQDVADILWDYVNKDTEWLFLNWDSSLCDLKYHCGKEEPYENYHGRRLKELGLE